MLGGHARGHALRRQQPQRGRGGELPGEGAVGATGAGQRTGDEIRGTVALLITMIVLDILVYHYDYAKLLNLHQFETCKV